MTIMAANTTNSMCRTSILVLLGLIALIAGAKWLAILVPAAMLVCFGAVPSIAT